jgi:UDP-N-acetylglucosamine 2-epimerase (non-hydrolysing)
MNDSEQLKPRLGFVCVTLQPSVERRPTESLSAIVDELAIADQFPVVFPMHPRTRRRMKEFGLSFGKSHDVRLLDPIGYNDSLTLTKHARCILTDSGGLQEESTFFRTPCLTLRPNTERPITVTLGSNRLTRTETLRTDFANSLSGNARAGQVPPLWDGHTATRIVSSLLET